MGDGSGPSPDEWAAMRRRVLHAAMQPGEARTGGVRAWAWAAAAAAVLIALVAGPELIDLGDRKGSRPSTERMADGPQAPALEGDRRPRTLQFTTRSGIRVIWTLDPGFELPGALLAGGSGRAPDDRPRDNQGS